MKILLLANSSSGLYDFRHELISALKCRADIIVGIPYGEKMDDLKALNIKTVDIPMSRRGMNPFRDFKLFLSYRKLIKAEKPDLVITYTIKPNIYGGYACRRAKVPYCVNITGLGTTFQNEGLLKKLVVFLYKTALKKVKTVFFENTANRDVFLDHKIVPEEKTCVLNGAGVNLERYRVMEYPDGETTRFLFIGRVMKEKGVDELFTAMKRLVSEGYDVHLDMLGEHEEDYKAAIDENEKSGWLTYHGYQTDVRPFIAASHCFVLPSWHEGMANTNLECAASGRPLITSDIPGCKEAVEDGISGFLCEKQNANSLYGKMKAFIELPYDARKQFGLCGRALMEKNFDKKAVVKNTLKHLL